MANKKDAEEEESKGVLDSEGDQVVYETNLTRVECDVNEMMMGGKNFSEGPETLTADPLLKKLCSSDPIKNRHNI